MFDLNSLPDKIALLAPDWDPSPILEQLRQPAAPDPRQAPAAPFSNLMYPQMQGPTPIPGDPNKLQQGPMAGLPMNTPAAPAPAAPLSPQQLAALHQMMPVGQPLPHAPAAAPHRLQGNIQLHPLVLPQQPEVKRKQGYGALFGR